MTITITELTSSYNNTDATSYTVASTSPAANSALALLWTSRHGTTAPGLTPTSVFGGSWVEPVAEQVDGISALGLWYMADVGGSPGSSGFTLNVDGGVTAIGAGWHLLQITDQDVASLILNQTFGPTGSTGTTANVTSQPAMSDGANNAQIFYSHHRANEAHNPEAGWTAGTSRSGTAPNMGMNVGWKIASEDTTATATWTTSSRWQSLYFEVKRASLVTPAEPTKFRRGYRTLGGTR